MNKQTNGRRICSRVGCYRAAAGVVRIVFYSEGREQPAGAAIVNLPLCPNHQLCKPLDLVGVDELVNMAAFVAGNLPPEHRNFDTSRTKSEPWGFDSQAITPKGWRQLH